MIYFLHGFLGSKEDWNEVISHLPSHYKCASLDLTHHIPQSFDKSAVVVGYSMGGRIALTRDHKGGLVLLGAHFGLSTCEERKARAKEENKILEELKGDKDALLQKWYAQPLFSTLSLQGDLLQRRKSIDFDKHAKLFEEFALSKQPLFTPPTHALLLYGEKDEKYAKIYRMYMNAKAIPDAGHAAHLENPKAVASSIQHYVETRNANRNA